MIAFLKNRAGSTAGIFAWIVCAATVAILHARAQESKPIQNDFERGRELSKTFCATCHLWPSPDLLDRRTWKEGAEPFMRKRMGFEKLDTSKPEELKIQVEWELIWNYYFSSAPTQAIPQPRHPPITFSLTNFSPVMLPYGGSDKLVSMVQVDSRRRQILVGNAETDSLDVLDPAGRLVSRLNLESPIVQLVERGNRWLAPLIWSLSPHDQRRGRIVQLARAGDAFSLEVEEIVDLPRPVHLQSADLNADGREDWVVCGYGNTTGELAWFAKNPGSGYTRNVLIDQPGAIRCSIHDFNGDRHPDLLVLMAQSREQLVLWQNDGRGGFESRVLREFPVTWGSSGMETVDFDGDGALDILLTNGDSGEFRSCMKGYHGVRLLRNTGRGQFEEKWFFPIHGAYRALALDFDRDGDKDVAVISFFPDYSRTPEESFVYLENDGRGSFNPRSLDEAVSGRWLVMDAGDVDGDGDPDIVLGAANHVPFNVPRILREKWATDGPTVLWLRNETPRK